MIKRAIHLHGGLRKLCEQPLKVAVSTPWEAVSACRALVPGFAVAVRKGAYTMTVDDVEGNPVDRDLKRFGFGRAVTDIHIVPLVAGAATGTAIIVGSVVAGLVLGAVIGAPRIADYGTRGEPEQKTSHLFDRPINVTEQGGPVPLVYGRFRVGSTIVSAGIGVEDMSYYPSEQEPNEFIGPGLGF